MSVGVRISRQLEKNLNRMDEVITKHLKGAVIQSALVDAETTAKRSVRVDTGRLRSSIHAKYTGKNQSFYYRDNENKQYDGTLVSRSTDTVRKFTVLIGTNVVYARKIERLDNYLMRGLLQSKRKLPERLRKAYRKAERELSRGWVNGFAWLGGSKSIGSTIESR